MNKIRVVDKRSKEKFIVDDEYLNGYAKLCGWQGTIVYISLCRHAGKDQTCFPSIDLMAEELAVDRKTIMKGIDTLIKWNVIGKDRIRNDRGTWKNNSYILFDKSLWRPKPSPSQGHGPSPSQGLIQVPVEDSKETHIKETHIPAKIKKAVLTVRRNSLTLGKEYPDADILKELAMWSEKSLQEEWDVGKNATAHMKNFRKWLDKNEEFIASSNERPPKSTRPPYKKKDLFSKKYMPKL